MMSYRLFKEGTYMNESKSALCGFFIVMIFRRSNFANFSSTGPVFIRSKTNSVFIYISFLRL